MSNIYWEAAKWFSNICYIMGTIMLLSPTLASTAITPWCLFIMGQVIICTNFVCQRNWSFVVLSVFFFIWDTLIIIQRLTSSDLFITITPILSFLETYVI